MIINPAVGMRVVGRSNAADRSIRNTKGVIITVRRFDQFNFDFAIALTNGGGWWCNKADFDLETPLTPEEIAAEEKRLDTLRRQQFAAKYL